jgi:acyl transferase domain-containing protein/NAD(P)-dependent dehydrogenase (short-subunit alcohol dehydrogenase family)
VPDTNADTLKRSLLALKDMRAKLDALEYATREPLAIVGIGCRFPGGADSPEKFWKLLQCGVDAVREVPPGRWSHVDPADDKATRHGGFLEDVAGFDPQFFGIAPREAMEMDPQQRLLLEVAWESLEHAGIAPSSLTGSRTGVFVGITTNDYLQFALGESKKLDAYSLTGTFGNFAAGRLSYILGLQGPCFAVDAACASSLVSVHMACQSLRARECDVALAGGVNIIVDPWISNVLSGIHALAPDGRCKTFDATADGLGRGEGCGMVVLKRLSDARRDHDNVIAVIRGSAISQDGRSSGLTVPNPKAQEGVIRAALLNAAADPHDVTYVETHGTGTPLGDPIELEALGAVFSEVKAAGQQIAVGSVKTNLSHLESAAGVAGLIKVALSLQHKKLPPNLHFKSPNPRLDWDRLPFRVPTTLQSWPTALKKRLAGVSSFGLSGIIAHALVEEAEVSQHVPAGRERSAHILTLSAPNEGAVKELARRYAGHIDSHPSESLPDLCYTANAGRAHFRQRLAVVANSSAAASESLSRYAAGERMPNIFSGHAQRPAPKVAFLFTGQGALYAGLGRSLYETQPRFRQTLEHCEALLRPTLEHPLLDAIYGEAASLLEDASYAQPALFAFEYALAELWQSWGVEPAALIGHSLGEYVAACIAGVLSLEDALRLICQRGRLMRVLPERGRMVAVFASEPRVISVIKAEAMVSIAAMNGPDSLVVSGEHDAVERVVRSLTLQGIRYQELSVTHAFHSPLMEPMVEDFARIASGITFSVPHTPLVSNVTGKLFPDDRPLVAEYWCRHLRQPVRFEDGMRTLSGLGCDVFLEIGPQPTLVALGQRCLPEGSGQWLASLRRNRSDWDQILESVASLYVQGADLNWTEFDKDYGRRKRPAPTYPFQRQRYWIDRRVRSVASQTPSSPPATAQPPHPLLGERLRSPAIPGALFRNTLMRGSPAYLLDHRILQAVVFPATAFLELALAGARAALSPDSHRLARIVFHEALVFDRDSSPIVQLHIKKSGANSAFEVFSGRDDVEESWKLHVTGTIVGDPDPTAPALDPVALAHLRAGSEISIATFYQELWKTGLEYGPAFRCIERLWVHQGEALGEIRLPQGLSDAEASESYAIHPALLDCCFQVLAGLDEKLRTGIQGVYLPVGIESVTVHRRASSHVWCVGRLHQTSGMDESRLIGDLAVYDEQGECIAEVRGLQLLRVARERFEQIAHKRPDVRQWLYLPSWREQVADSSPRPSESMSCVIVGGGSPVGSALAELLGKHAVHYRLVSSAETLGVISEFSNVIYLSGFDRPSGELSPAELETLQRASCGGLLSLAKTLVQHGGPAFPRLWVVTRQAQSVADRMPVDVAQGSLCGLTRVLALEHPELRAAVVDLDSRDPATSAGQLFRELQSADSESEIAVRGEKRYVARLSPFKDGGLAVHENYHLDIPSRGVFDNLILSPASRRPPGPREVEIRVHAAGLNFRDVLNALGMYPGGPIPLGGECAGTIVDVGSEVSDLKPGDSVLALASRAFSQYVTVSSQSVARMPASLSFEEATTIPVTFATAYYALHHVAGMKAGDRVLIHAGAGGVGMAAIQLASQAGAEVFVTAGSEEKRAFLRSLGVRHVMSSRSLDFADEIMAVTKGEGLDIVLNSLTGDFIAKGLSVLRQGGRFLEIGKVEIWDLERVARFKTGVSYSTIALDQILDNDPSRIAEILRELMSAFERRDLKALPYSAFSIQDAAPAFRYMAQARHIGKIVLQMTSIGRALHVDPQATYLITGGMGSLGLLVARWLVGQGAKNLALLGRRGPTVDARATIAELELSGARFAVFQSDVGDEEQLASALRQIAETLPPLRGVFHLAGILDDGIVAHQTWERFAKVFAPKIHGAWNLHRLTRSHNLDLFVMFSSASSILGMVGQSNYAAANAFLDGLAHHRRAKGLHGLSINWGPWEESGMAANVAHALDSEGSRSWQAQGLTPLTTPQAFEALRSAIESNVSQVAVLPIDWTRFLRRYRGEVPQFFAEVSRTPASLPESSQNPLLPELIRRLSGIPPEEGRNVVGQFVREHAVNVLGLSASETLNARQPLSELGLDSMMAVELRNALAAGMGRSISAGILYFHPSIEALTAYVATELQLTDPNSTRSTMPPASLLDEIEGLAEAELDARLAEITGEFQEQFPNSLTADTPRSD